MPIYEYICNKCKKDFEILQKITDKPKQRCPHCKGKLEKMMSQSAFHLKGSGWSKSVSQPKDSSKDASCESEKASKPCGSGACHSQSTPRVGNPKKETRSVG